MAQPRLTRGTATSHTWHSDVSQVAQPRLTRGTVTSRTSGTATSRTGHLMPNATILICHTKCSTFRKCLTKFSRQFDGMSVVRIACHVVYKLFWFECHNCRSSDCAYLSRCTFLAPDPLNCLPSVLILDFVLWGTTYLGWGNVVMMKLLLLLIFCWGIYGFGGGGAGGGGIHDATDAGTRVLFLSATDA